MSVCDGLGRLLQMIAVIYLTTIDHSKSLALALYFASKGVGNVQATTEGPKIPYESTARVLVRTSFIIRNGHASILTHR